MVLVVVVLVLVERRKLIVMVVGSVPNFSGPVFKHPRYYHRVNNADTVCGIHG